MSPAGATRDDAQPLVLLAQGHAGDRAAARLVPAIRNRFPGRPLYGLGGPEMQAEGVRLVARTDGISAMGYSGLLPQLPAALRVLLAIAAHAKRRPPAAVIAVDIWQPLQVLHRLAPQLRAVPHLCYLPPGPNLICESRVHGAVSEVFSAILTPFRHQLDLYARAGGRVRAAAHAGLQAAREETAHCGAREPLLALLPGSRQVEVRNSLPVQAAAAVLIKKAAPGLRTVVCCATAEIERFAAASFPQLERARNARQVLGRATLGIICSGTAALEAAVLGCPGVVTYHVSALQRWEWKQFHVAKLRRLRAAGVASPYVALPNIIAGTEIYRECLDSSALEIAAAALRELAMDPAARRADLDAIRNSVNWDDAGQAVAQELARILK